MRRIVIALLAAAGLLGAPAARAQDATYSTQSWSWQGIFGQYDDAQLQRGFEIYRDVCSNCHSLKLVAYRSLTEIGMSGKEIVDYLGGVVPNQPKRSAIQVTEWPGSNGQPVKRQATPADHFVGPYFTEADARAANGGGLPPDLSLIIKARKGGPDYVYSVLTGFVDPPAGVTVPAGLHYNAAFPGHNIAMPPPLRTDNLMTYDDKSKAPSVEAEARDVVAFLTWASEPELAERHNLGVKTLVFLFVLTVVFYVVKVRIWSRVEH